MAVIRLPRLPNNWQKQPQLFERYWDEAMTSIEKSLNQILAIPGIEAAIVAANAAAAAANAAATAAGTAAGNAQDAADGAQAATDAQAQEASIVTSYIDAASFTSPLLEVDDAGVVTVDTHDRVYGNTTLNPTVSVTGDIVNTSAVAGDVIRIYYNDPTRAGGAITYLFTIDPAPPPVQGGSTHSVGTVVVPAIGTSDGEYIKPPGYVDRNPIP